MGCVGAITLPGEDAATGDVSATCDASNGMDLARLDIRRRAPDATDPDVRTEIRRLDLV